MLAMSSWTIFWHGVVGFTLVLGVGIGLICIALLCIVMAGDFWEDNKILSALFGVLAIVVASVLCASAVLAFGGDESWLDRNLPLGEKEEDSG